ncbi:hypothetical protein QJS10_CPB18g01393 [Acorus calamus]|uniref:Defective in cullin neddylation protein n=1 Tax=Acorus calamus TaxID=4465 RepID=A0AAV9CS02_ACOCL|nr:hypothetical protein QJS10_CPB18g01393 [Acorus calamus]
MEIFDIYLRYCDIMSRSALGTTKQELFMLSEIVGSREKQSLRCGRTYRYVRPHMLMCAPGEMIFYELVKLMEHIDLSVDSSQFNRFYRFVFFICRENGQKNISVSSAVDAWKLVLNGRFRFLNEWCEFVQNHCRHSISEDTWDQFLVFSCCVHEDLVGHDPNGAWPILIDDFVEHMYRKTQLTGCTSLEICCSCGETPTEPSISNTLQGLKLFSGSKRRLEMDADAHEDKGSIPKSGSSTPPMHGKGCKKSRTNSFNRELTCLEALCL